ncbi:MAG: SDR family NAD(P)-dependent oxidoreductase [Verrucomicrobiales bacterium]|nr:SDR family NAD(P)-dependent oxidoreductase [Verrucomicrobiales bacterium]
MNALITGGRGGLARVLTESLSQAGFDSVLAPGRDELDVCSVESVDTFFAEQNLDRLDLLVNNAGINADRPLAKMTEQDWDSVIQTNLSGAFRVSRSAFKIMLKKRCGHIVNIGSFSGVCPPVGQANYAAAKAGLIGFTQALAEEGGKRGLRVNCVLPGFLEGTKMTADLPEEVIEQARARHVLGRLNTVEDAAEFISFLHVQMGNVSGQVFQLDSRIRRWT